MLPFLWFLLNLCGFFAVIESLYLPLDITINLRSLQYCGWKLADFISMIFIVKRNWNSIMRNSVQFLFFPFAFNYISFFLKFIITCFEKFDNSSKNRLYLIQFAKAMSKFYSKGINIIFWLLLITLLVNYYTMYMGNFFCIYILLTFFILLQYFLTHKWLTFLCYVYS